MIINQLKTVLKRFLFHTYLGKVITRILLKKTAFFQSALFIDKLISELKILNGPFRGLKYPKAESHCGALVPRLIGSYESQLHESIRKMINKNNYDRIIVIGCAEGYYAIGLALLFPGVPTLAIDIDEHAISLAKEMAAVNGVSEQISFSIKDVQDHLTIHKPTDRCLIVCDCEGCEFKIFSKMIINNLWLSDLIIEMHYSCSFSDKEFYQLFRKSHSIEKIKCKRDKVDDYPELMNLPVEMAKWFIHEDREEDAEWLVLWAKADREFGYNKH